MEPEFLNVVAEKRSIGKEWGLHQAASCQQDRELHKGLLQCSLCPVREKRGLVKDEDFRKQYGRGVLWHSSLCRENRGLYVQMFHNCPAYGFLLYRVGKLCIRTGKSDNAAVHDTDTVGDAESFVHIMGNEQAADIC